MSGKKNTFHFDSRHFRNIMSTVLPLILFVSVILWIRFHTTLSAALVHKNISPQPLKEAKISLISDMNAYTLGQTATVAIRVFTGGHSSDGTDVYLKYDPSFLQISSQGGFAKGLIYREYPYFNVDSAKGVIMASGIASISQGGYTGLGEFGRLSFKTLALGSTAVSVVYKPNTTDYSNVVETGSVQNLLKSSAKLALTIVDKPASPSMTLSCSHRVLQICRDSSGRMGAQWCSNANDPLSCNAGCFSSQTGTKQGCAGYESALSN